MEGRKEEGKTAGKAGPRWPEGHSVAVASPPQGAWQLRPWSPLTRVGVMKAQACDCCRTALKTSTVRSAPACCSSCSMARKVPSWAAPLLQRTQSWMGREQEDHPCRGDVCPLAAIPGSCTARSPSRSPCPRSA